MKKLFMVAMAIVVATGFVACTKDDASAPTYKVEFTVGEKGGFEAGSRAVKTAWAEGDQILIITKPLMGSYDEVAIPNSDANTIRLIYNGSVWTVDRTLTAEEIAARPEGYGPYAAFHYRVKDGKKVGLGADFGGGDVQLVNYYGGEVLECAHVFTITDGVIDLGEINMELAFADDLVQVSVPGLDLDVNPDWGLTVLTGDYVYGTYAGFNHPNFTALWENEICFRPSPGVANYANYRDTPYVVNGTDASFVFRFGSFTDESTTATYGKYKFMLYNFNTADAYVYTVDRGAYDAVNDEYEVNLEGEKAYVLPTFDGDGAQTNWKPVSVI